MTKRINEPVPRGKKTGLIPRDYRRYPQGYLGPICEPFSNDLLIPESEWADRLAENRKNKAGLLDLREANYDVLKSLDQDGKGLCWAFSSTKAVMYVRMLMNEPGIRLSAYWVAGQVKGWKDEGGWGSASLSEIVKDGVPADSFCPDYNRSHDTPEARENAKNHKVTQWLDGSENPTEAQQQMVSMLLRGQPSVVDLSDMGHSMCAIDIDSLKPLTIVYDNSWGEQGDHGLYRGTGARAKPDGLVIPMLSLATTV